MVCLITDSLDPDAMPDNETLTALDMPVLWFITGRDTARWRSLVSTLEALRDKDKKPFTSSWPRSRRARKCFQPKATNRAGWKRWPTTTPPWPYPGSEI